VKSNAFTAKSSRIHREFTIAHYFWNARSNPSRVAQTKEASVVKASRRNDPKAKAKNGEGPHWIAIAALIVSVLSAGYTIYRSSSFGEITPLEPSGYAIVRGVDPAFEGEPKPGEGVGVGPWPSDHVVLPMEWSNSSGSSELVRDPVLIFSELDQNGEPTGRKIEFFLVGELPEISATAFNNINEKPYTFTNTLVLDPHSVSQRFLVFRVEDWEGKNHCFRFHQGQRYSVSIEFNRVPESPILGLLYRVLGRYGTRSKDLVEDLKILETANWITPYGEGKSIGWDYFALLPGSRATSNKPVPEDTQKHYAEPQECSQ
jgi:hypothetical protein